MWERIESTALATAGALVGVYKYYRPSPAALAWSGIVAYEIAAPPGQLLSEGCDTALERYPYLTKLAIGLTALHLANAIPEKYDMIHQGVQLLKRSKNSNQ